MLSADGDLAHLLSCLWPEGTRMCVPWNPPPVAMRRSCCRLPAPHGATVTRLQLSSLAARLPAVEDEEDADTAVHPP
ncbi:hypothetical protein ACLOJK_019641 [Asimina triloba]